MFSVGGFIPDSLRASPTDATVLVYLHSAACTECAAYIRELDSIADELRVWDARLRLMLGGADCAVVIADRFGQVFYTFACGIDHHFPAPVVIAEALKFIGTLCPE